METGQKLIDPADQAAVIQTLCEKLRANYVFPDIAERISARITECLAAGTYAQISDGEQFANTLTGHIQEVHPDKHLRVFWHSDPLLGAPPEGEGPTPEQKAEWDQFARQDNFGIYKVERLAGNVGYLDIRGFPNPAAGGGETAAAAMNFVAHTGALIVDLRKNGGGHPAMVALISSYLFGEESVHLNSLHWRSGAGEVIQQFWTLPYVPGKRFGDKPVYVLTSKDTFSGGEEFANNLKTRQRATLIGEVTGGGANPGGGYRLHPHFDVFIPSGRAVNPITGTSWEGTGVTPDIPAAPELAFQVAYRLALQAIIAGIGEAASMPARYLKDEAQAALKELETK